MTFGECTLIGVVVKSIEFVPKQNKRGIAISERLVANVYSLNKGQAFLLKTTMWGKMAKLHSQTLTPGTSISAVASMYCFAGSDLVKKIGFTISRVGCLEKAGVELMWMYELLLNATNRGLFAWWNQTDGIRMWDCPSCGSKEMLCFRDAKGDKRPRLYACDCGYRRSTPKWTKDRLDN